MLLITIACYRLPRRSYSGLVRRFTIICGIVASISTETAILRHTTRVVRQGGAVLLITIACYRLPRRSYSGLVRRFTIICGIVASISTETAILRHTTRVVRQGEAIADSSDDLPSSVELSPLYQRRQPYSDIRQEWSGRVIEDQELSADYDCLLPITRRSYSGLVRRFTIICGIVASISTETAILRHTTRVVRQGGAVLLISISCYRSPRGSYSGHIRRSTSTCGNFASYYDSGSIHNHDYLQITQSTKTLLSLTVRYGSVGESGDTGLESSHVCHLHSSTPTTPLGSSTFAKFPSKNMNVT
ncbi:hypothetical protein J6590_019696 [Homalodisca vitripennis]|nr:hypothetical protein J6590_019696 [Homalodisca vitripennis]